MDATINDISADPECVCCGGREFNFLGSLGCLDWFKCRACGWRFHIDTREEVR